MGGKGKCERGRDPTVTLNNVGVVPKCSYTAGNREVEKTEWRQSYDWTSLQAVQLALGIARGKEIKAMGWGRKGVKGIHCRYMQK